MLSSSSLCGNGGGGGLLVFIVGNDEQWFSFGGRDGVVCRLNAAYVASITFFVESTSGHSNKYSFRPF